jgi:hypothetical protein
MEWPFAYDTAFIRLLGSCCGNFRLPMAKGFFNPATLHSYRTQHCNAYRAQHHN